MPARLADERAAALRAGYDATPAPPISFERYTELLDDWDVKAIVKDDKCIGAAYFKGPEFHVAVLPEWHGRWMNRRVLHDILGSPDAVTKVRPGDEHVKNLLRRLGFHERADGTFARG